MKTKYRTKIKINGVDIEASVNMKTDEITFSDNGTTYHFTREEKAAIQKKIKKILNQAAEEKFKR